VNGPPLARAEGRGERRTYRGGGDKLKRIPGENVRGRVGGLTFHASEGERGKTVNAKVKGKVVESRRTGK